MLNKIRRWVKALPSVYLEKNWFLKRDWICLISRTADLPPKRTKILMKIIIQSKSIFPHILKNQRWSCSVLTKLLCTKIRICLYLTVTHQASARNSAKTNKLCNINSNIPQISRRKVAMWAFLPPLCTSSQSQALSASVRPTRTPNNSKAWCRWWLKISLKKLSHQNVRVKIAEKLV